MNKLIKIFLFLNLPIFLFSQDLWQEIGGEKHNLSVEINSLTQERVDTLYLEEDQVLLYTWVGEPEVKEHPVLEYKLKISNYPSSFIHSDSSFQLIEGFLNSTILDLLDNAEYELMMASLLFKDGYPGKEFKFKKLATNSLLIVESYLIQNQLLELITVSKFENWFSNSKSRFYDSVKLIDRNDNKMDYGIPIIKSDSYSIKFPQTPEITNLFVEREEGYVNTKTKILEQDTDMGNPVLMATEAKYPKTFFVKEADMDAFYEDSMKSSINSMNGEFASKKEILYKDKKGIEFYAKIYNGAATVCFRTFYQDGTMYMTGVIFIGEALNEEAKLFLDSFEIKGK